MRARGLLGSAGDPRPAGAGAISPAGARRAPSEGRRPSPRPRPPPSPLPTTSSFFSGSTFRRYTGDRPQVCLVLCCCLLSFQPRAFEPLYKYRLVGQIPPITPCFADVHRFGRLAAAVRRQSALFSCRITSRSGGVRIPIYPSCRATRGECTGVTSVHQVCHFNLTFGLSGCLVLRVITECSIWPPI